MSTIHATVAADPSVALIAIFLLTLIPALPVAANSAPQALPFSQDWTDTGRDHGERQLVRRARRSSASSGRTSRRRPASIRRRC